MKISANSVKIIFDGHEYVKQADIELRSPEITLLYGPSGSGKTSLFNVICGLLSPPGGHGGVLWGDYSLKSIAESNKVRWRYISMIYSTFFFLDSLNVEQNIKLPAVLVRKDPAEIERSFSRLLEVFSFDSSLENLNLDSLCRRRIGQLSNGQKELVGIARAFMLDSPFIFADEMLRSFNAEAEHVLWERLLDSDGLGLGKDKGFFMITHKEHLKDDQRIDKVYTITNKELLEC